MSDLLKKIKDWSSRLTSKKTSYVKSGIRPTHDWFVILITAQTIIVCMVIFAFYFYVKINNGELFSSIIESSPNEAQINNNLLNKTINDLNTRKENLEKIKAGGLAPIDPSL